MHKKLIGLISLSIVLLLGIGCEKSEKIREGFFISTTTVTINTSSLPHTTEALPIPQSLENIYPTGTININPSTQAPLVTSSISEEYFSTSSINKNDPKTWPRFEFKELGFSMQLPFEKNELEIEYGRCKDGVVYRKKNNSDTFIKEKREICIKSKSDYSYYQIIVKKGNYLALSSIVGYAPIEGEGGILTDDKGRIVFKQQGKPIVKAKDVKGTFYALEDKKFRPLRIIFNQDVEFIMINPLENRYVYPEDERYNPKFAAIFNLPKDQEFKSVVIAFLDQDLDESQLITAIKTVKFFN